MYLQLTLHSVLVGLVLLPRVSCLWLWLHLTKRCLLLLNRHCCTPTLHTHCCLLPVSSVTTYSFLTGCIPLKPVELLYTCYHSATYREIPSTRKKNYKQCVLDLKNVYFILVIKVQKAICLCCCKIQLDAGSFFVLFDVLALTKMGPE